MKWLTSNLLPVTILAAFCILIFLASFVRIRFVKPNWFLLGIGTLFLAALIFGVIEVVRKPPGQTVVDEKNQDGPQPQTAKTALERLRLEWNAQDVANWAASETLADLSEIAYQSPFEAERSYRARGFTQVLPVVQGSMIGYVITGEDVTVVAFRGTDFAEVSDWIANLSRSATETPHGAVHRGFYLAYLSMKPQIDAILKDRETKHLWVTGHSLGGALALLCAYDLEEVEKRQLRGVMTFGQPMVARREFANYIDRLFVGRYARFVNRDDIVPKVPPSHVPCGSLVWFTDAGVKRSKIRQVLYSATEAYSAPEASEKAMPVRGPAAMMVEEEVEITPLSDAEFDALQAQLKATQTEDRVNTLEVESIDEGAPKVAYSKQVPSLIADHSMWLYIDKIHTLLGIPPTPQP